MLVALGAERRERALAQIVGALPALVIAPLVAVGSAYLVSPAFPVGSARALESDPGLYHDAVVFAGGGAVWFVLLATLTIAVAWIATRSSASRPARSRSATLLGSSEAGARALPLEVGARYALQPGTPRRGLRRATLVGLVIAIAGAVGSAVFVASLDDFTSSPDRYGIRFDLSMELPNTNLKPVLAEIAGDPNLAAVAAAHNGLVIIDGRTVDGYGVEPVKGALDPVVRDGRAPRGESEIAIGPKLLDALGKRVGDHVRLTTATGDRELEVVGRSFSPTTESASFNGEALLTPSMIDRYGANPAVSAIATIRSDVDHPAAFARARQAVPVRHHRREHSPSARPGAEPRPDRAAALRAGALLRVPRRGRAHPRGVHDGDRAAPRHRDPPVARLHPPARRRGARRRRDEPGARRAGDRHPARRAHRTGRLERRRARQLRRAVARDTAHRALRSPRSVSSCSRRWSHSSRPGSACAGPSARPCAPNSALHSQTGAAAPNQVASARGSSGSVRSPAQATCPSGRISTAGGRRDLAEDRELPHAVVRRRRPTGLDPPTAQCRNRRVHRG